MTTKVFQSRSHRERAQPASRTRLGLLEKKKDYILRARDYQSKKKRLHTMKVKAAYKNPDEFYFGMIKSRVDKKTGKVRNEADHEKMAAEVIKLMKSQDLQHIDEMIRVNEAKLDKFKQEHAITIGNAFKAGNTDVKAENDEKDASDAENDSDNKQSRKQKQNTLKITIKAKTHLKFVENDEELADLIIENDKSEEEKEQEQAVVKVDTVNEQILEEYTARIERIKVLKIASKKLVQQRLAASKGRKKKIGEDSNGIPVYKFDQIRQK